MASAFPASRSSVLATLSLALIVGGGCKHADFRAQYNEMRPSMLAGDWQTAGAQLEKAKEKVYGESDRVMYWLNMGTVLHYAGDPIGSQDNLVKAESAMQDLWTKSISAEASKFIINESMQSYPGEDFEKVLVYFYTALNNVEQKKIQDAIVEARRADELLKKMQIHLEKEGEVGTLYKQDAFMLWLVGLFYELEGRSGVNDAFLAYKAAYKAYREEYAGKFGAPVPKYLGEDLVRTAKLLGFGQDAAHFAQETGATGETIQKLSSGQSEVILILASGEAPFKQQFEIDAPMPDHYLMRIALPKFVPVPTQVSFAEARSDGVAVRTEVAEPITTIVLKNFEHRQPAIQARAIARAIVKYAATKGAEAAASGGKDASGSRKLAGALVGLAGNIAGALSESADTRSWTTLPANIGVQRFWLPPGRHKLEIRYHDASGQPIGREQTVQVDLKPGERRIISVRSLY